VPIQRFNYDYQPSLFELQDDASEESGVVTPEEAQRRSMVAKLAFQELKTQPKWYDEYLKLLDGGWPWRVAAYIAWAASPRGGRWPETQDKLASEVLGLTSDRQIATWRKRNPSISEVIAALQVAPMLDHRADVIEALIESAKDPDYKSHQDRKLFLEITGDFVPAARWLEEMQRSSGDGLKGKSDAELENYLPGEK